MEDGRDEEVQREAMPPSTAEDRSLPQCVPPPAEQRRSIHRQSILYPLVAGFLPVGTVVHESARKLSSPHTLLSPEMGYGAKVQPSDIIGMTGASERILNTDITSVTEFSVRADMQIFPLRFRDTVQEEAFCKHFNVYVAQKVRVASQIVILINVIMLVAQFLTQLRLLNNHVFVSRIAILALSVIFQAATFTSWFRRNFDRNLLAHYLLLDFAHQLPRFLFLVGSLEEEAEEASTGTKTDELTLFASQKSVRAMNLIFILVIFIASGMRFTMASVCACYHMVVKGLFAVIFCHECTWDDMDTTTNVAMITFCTLTAYHSERYVRQEFLERLRVDDERKRRDNLLETMLPVHIKERLKDNRTDGLAESYDEVSILFCYVSNFQALSKHTSAIELVQLMNRIIFCFDRATDAHGVYKVEAIAETYMCAAGVPQRDPFHCEKVADMALTMMRICEKESWSFNGVDIQLQMGIHSGPVVAGVVGSKTYSYHLFGDTVNTSSRVCSSGCAGKIQISSRSRELLARTGAFVISERGTMNLKGKGMTQLFWLEGKNAEPSRGGRFACSGVSSTFENAVEESIRTKDLEYKSPLHHRSDDYLGCMNAVEIRKFTLDFRRKNSRHHLKFPGKISRVQAAPESEFLSPELSAESKCGRRDPRNIQSVNNTASEMERGFRIEHNRDSTPQFCVALCLCALYLFVTIIYRAYIKDDFPNKAVRNARAYAIYGTTIVLLLIIVQLLRRYPRLARLKERWGTGTGLVFILALNLQLLTAADTSSFKDSQPRGAQKATFLDGNLLHAVIVGLVMRLRFRNAVLVNLWGFLVFVACASLRRAEPWADIFESFSLLFTISWMAVHFGYKRELGLRHDFLLKCTLELEKQKCEDLLTNMLPSKQYAEALMQQSTIVDELAEVTLLYSDMVGFTPLGAKLDPAGICVMLNQIYSAFDRHLDDLGVYKMDTVGDAFIVVGGLPGHKSSKNHAAAIAAFAVEMLHEIDRFCAEENVTLQMRIGIHTGNVVGGVVGIKKPRYLIWGRHTVIANLMESRGVAGRIQLSETTYAHLRGCPEFRIEERADRVQISENDTIRTYFLEPGHLAVKDAVMARYLQEARRVGTAEIFALDQLRTCLLPSHNSPLSRCLEVPLSRRRHSDQQATSSGEVVPAPPALVKTFSFGSMMNDR
ncbi:hypothetical protein PRNP1_013465 [Phytophthora ramorum]